MEQNINKELYYQQFVRRELGISHPTYDEELEFYELVKTGNIAAIKERKQSGALRNLSTKNIGMLSENKIQNLKYHIIITVAMICRFCIEGGLDEVDSYGLSDIYIRRIDKASTVERLYELHEEMIFDYTGRMKNLSKKYMNIYCIKAMDYISDNLHKQLTVVEIAEHIGIERTYLSKLFKKETGQTVVEFIRQKKIHTAQSMLVYSELSCSEIAELLGFASQSYFTENFKSVVGITPYEYKKRYYRKHWVSSE